MSSKWLRLFLVAALVGALLVPAAVASAADDDARVFATLGQCNGVVHNAANPYSIEYPSADTVYDFWGRAIVNAKGYDAGVVILEDVAKWPLGVVRNTYILGSDYDDLICGATGSAAAIAIPIATGGNDYIKARGGNDMVFGQDGDNAFGPLNLWTPANVIGLRNAHGLFGGMGDMIWGGMGNDYINAGWSILDYPASIIPIPPVLAGLEPLLPLPFSNTFSQTLAIWNGLGGFGFVDAMLIGGAGEDTIVGGFGSDFLRGRANADTILDPGSFGAFNPPVDLVYGDGGDDSMLVGLAVSGWNAANDSTYVYSGRGDDTVASGFGTDFLVGGPGDDFLLDLGNQFGFVGYTPSPRAGVYLGDWMEGGLGADYLITNLAGTGGHTEAFTGDPWYVGAGQWPSIPFGVTADQAHDMEQDLVWVGGDGNQFPGTAITATNQVWSCGPELLTNQFGQNLGLTNDDEVYWGGLLAPFWLGGAGPGDAIDTIWGFDEFIPQITFFDAAPVYACAIVHPGA